MKERGKRGGRPSFRQFRIAKEQAGKTLSDWLMASASLMFPPADYRGATQADRLSRLPASVRQYLEAEKDILASAIRQTPPSSRSLEQIRRALSRSIKRVRYDGRHIAVDADGMRQSAESLVRYLKLIEICGPVHTGCKFDGCNEVVFGGRGNKQFCSDKHRIQYWSYKHQREYFRDKQREARKSIRAGKVKRAERQTKRPAQVTESPKRA